MQDLPTTCKVCSKKLNVVEVFFNNRLCDICQVKQNKRSKTYCSTCGKPIQGKEVHYKDGLYYCSEHIPV